MKPIPSWLPSAGSHKWHNRRRWDWLGYLRVRSLANPNWYRDLDWLIQVVLRRRPTAPGPHRDAIDSTIRAAKRYRKLGRQGQTNEEDWDSVLEALDHYLELIQQEHLNRVEDAKCSGRRVTSELVSDRTEAQ